jgi:two-component system, NarL family, sensor kinase
MRFITLSFWMIFVGNFSALCQNIGIDSLLQQIHRTSDRERKLDLVLALCKRNDTHLDTFNRYAFIADELSSTSNDPVKIAYAKYNVAWAYYYLNSNDSARYVIDLALKKLSLNSTEERKIYYKLKGFKATTYQGQRRNSEALEILYPLLTETEQHADSIFIAQTMHQIAVIEGQQSNPQKLISWEQKALKALPFSDPNAKIISATIYATVGKAYLQLERLNYATIYHLKAIDIFRQEQDLYNLGVVLLRQSSVYIAQKNALDAKKILDELSALNDEIKFGEGDLNYYLSFIQYWLLIGENDKVIESCKEHLYGENASSNESIRLSYLKALSDAYKSKEDWKNYSSTIEEYIHAKDSFYKDNSVDAMAEMETKYEVQKKENLIIQQNFDLSRKNLLFYGSLVLLVLVLIIGWLIFKNYQRKNEMQLILMQEEDKRLRIQAVKDAEENERKRIAADLHDSLGSYAASIKANADDIIISNSISKTNVELLQANAHQMVSLLGDTIWALRKEKLSLIDISDRVKVFLNRLKLNYSHINMRVEEDILSDYEFQPNQAFHLFMIVQEAVNNALKHSRANEIVVAVNSRDSWEIRIRDNGTGMEGSIQSVGGGNGLINMKQRAQDINCIIQWNSAPNTGTEVLIHPNTF